MGALPPAQRQLEFSTAGHSFRDFSNKEKPVITDAQVRKMMEEMSKHGEVGNAVLLGVDRKTASKYIELGEFPSELHTERIYRTRVDPFSRHWAEMAALLPGAQEVTG